MTDAQRSSVKSQYAAAGIKLIVSVFGSSDVPTTTGADPVDTANTVGAWVKKYNLDGVDVDYEVNKLSYFLISRLYSNHETGPLCL